MLPDGNRMTCRFPRPCDPSELAPLVERLRSGDPVGETLAFPRGTLTPDGRLDLCKQEVGPGNLERIASALQGNGFVRSLLLGADFIGDAGMHHLASLLEANSTLETLFLGCNGITARGVEVLAPAAAEHRSLRGLWLKRNPLGLEGARHLAPVLERSPGLRTVDLVQTGLGGRGLAVVVEALLRRGRPLERLYVCGNGLTPADASALVELVQSACPEELYLRANHLGDEGCEVLLDACARARDLRVLGLASNGLSARAARAVAAALDAGSAFTVLDLSQSAETFLPGVLPNRLGDPGALEVASSLRWDPPLERLSLGGNGVGAVGGMAILDALSTNRHLGSLMLGREVPREVKARLAQALQANQGKVTSWAVPVDIAQIRSVYRTKGRRARILPAAPPMASAPDPEAVNAPPQVSPRDLEMCTRVLDELTAHAAVFLDGDHRELRASANRLVAAIVEESRRRRSRRPTRAQRKIEELAIGVAPPPPGSSPVPDGPAPIARPSTPRSCYVCKARVAECHPHHPFLCRGCGEINLERRKQTGDLSGQVALVTGGRIKIGHQVALKLLEAGSTVFVTTRFPRDAAQRFRAHPAFGGWGERLHVIGLDLRDLPAVARFTSRFAQEVGQLDVLINNAAITVHRPPGYYTTLIARELESSRTGERLIHSLTERSVPRLLEESSNGTSPMPLDEAGAARSAVLAERTLVPSGVLESEISWFPQSLLDSDGQVLDLREVNSWLAEVEQVSTGELLEVHLVNSLAPFVLIRGLLPLMRSAPARYRHIVNVSAMEGSFSRSRKTVRHPHTNMAKAGLNMLTRTAAERLGLDRILMNSVDTGWVTDERPYPRRVDGAETFVPPLDAVDGAARVCDPIFRAARGEFVGFGQFLKDYRATRW
jgi:NAD(P)-dependent dehydrogenase (short-subunit alcohol dehydrogenase family)